MLLCFFISDYFFFVPFLRQISELEMQKKQSSKTLTRLMAETRDLENHVTTLHMSVSGFNGFSGV